jgi:hypothetical protein
MGNMKREQLSEIINGISAEQIDGIMKLHGATVESLKQKYSDYDDIKAKLEEANEQIESFKGMDIDSVKAAADEWKTKFETAQKESEDKLNRMQYEYAIKDKVNGIKFSSESAKKAFVSDALSKDFTIENGNVLGFDDYVTEYKAQDSAAFAPEVKEDVPKVVKGQSAHTLLGGDYMTQKYGNNPFFRG